MTDDELIFTQRMLPHFMAGKSAAEAAQAVIDDDARIFNAFSEVAHDQHALVASSLRPDGYSVRTRYAKGDAIREHITSTVYERLRAGLLPATNGKEAPC